MAYDKKRSKKKGAGVHRQKRRLGKPSPFDIKLRREEAYPERPKPKLEKEKPPKRIKKRPPKKRPVVLGPRY